MGLFLEATIPGNKQRGSLKVLIRTSKIIAIQEDESNNYSCVRIEGGNSITLEESYEDIKNLLRLKFRKENKNKKSL